MTASAVCKKHGIEKHPVAQGEGKRSKLICRTCDAEYAKKYYRNDPRGSMLSRARKRAKKHDVPFYLSKNDITIPTHCPILGIELKMGEGSSGFIDSSPSLDRTRPERGYVRGNVNVISYRANYIKSDASLEELEKVVAYLKG